LGPVPAFDSGFDINNTTRSSRELLVEEKLLDSNYYENKEYV